MKALAVAAALLAVSTAPGAQSVVPAGSEIVFTSKQMGVPVEGRFAKWSATLSFDPKQPEAGQVTFSIDTASATFGSPEVDAELPRRVWLDTAKFPTASFQSSAIKALGGAKYEVSGNLTIKGTAQPVVVPVTLAPGLATGSFVVKRLAFKIGDGEWSDTSMLADEVQVRFKLILQGL